MASLLIVESPAKCSKIQGFLGPGWRVIATMGHIRALEEDLNAVGIERDFEPRFQFLKEKGKAIQGIKDAAAKAAHIYLASDDDREGEAISYSVALLLKLDPVTTPRAVFREITETAVKKAVEAPRRLDMNRVWAQQARAVLDMMVGFTISPLLWKYVGQALSAGRCQTPALRLLVDREREIGGFRAETTWRVKGMWATATATPFEACMTEDLEDEESAMNYLENLHDDVGGTVVAAATKPTHESPPKPLITSTLQQEVSATMGIQPKNTMRIAQRLYEAGNITYMRTDSAVLSEEARTAAGDWVLSNFGEGFLAAVAEPEAPSAPTKKKGAGGASKKKDAAGGTAQEAHEAIRPTHFEVTQLPADEDWNAADRKVYTLIWQRAVQSVMAAAKGEQRTVDILAKGDPNEFVWRATWRRQTFAGWRRIGAASTNLDNEDGALSTSSSDASASAWAAAGRLVVGTALEWKTLEAEPFVTKPPGRYTEATLVRELEKRGIGRPSTFAQLVGTIMDKGYAEKRDSPAREMVLQRHRLDYPSQWPPSTHTEKKMVGAERQKVAATALGVSVLDFCLKEFGALFAYEFTAQMEARLDAIAEGKEAWKVLCRDTWGSYKEKYEGLKKGEGTVAAAVARERHFPGGIKAVQSKKGPLLLKEGATKADATVFYGWPPSNPAFQSITEAEVAAFVAEKVEAAIGDVVGDYEGQPIVRKSGPYGPYVECSGVKVPWASSDTEETLCEKLAAKKGGAGGALHTLGPFEFRNGPYGVYFFKKDVVGKGRKFVGLASGVDPKALTLEAATKLFQDGLQAKAKAKAYGAGAGAASAAPAPARKKRGTK
jgi:DNA topoisomerase-1